jgi:hypothetical protein
MAAGTTPFGDQVNVEKSFIVGIEKRADVLL